MNGDLSAIRDYLQPSSNSFWQWTEDGKAIVWRDGRTIAFRQEVESVLSRLQPLGLPPFVSIVLFLATCRNSLPTTAEQLAALKGTTWDWIHELPSKLVKITYLPLAIRFHLNTRAELAAMIFESRPFLTSTQFAEVVVKALADGVTTELLENKVGVSITVAEFVQQTTPLNSGLHRVDLSTLALRLETGLEQELLPVEKESPPVSSVRQLLEQLRDDEELAGMVRLAQNLLAVVSLPRPLADHDEMPIGGVSDISNRGTLDRLLISELAQDDDTLMMRVAMREALYLRRETPPRNPPRSRRIIVDSGLRLWGVPRVFATSVALSLAAMSDPDGCVEVFRPTGEELQPVDFTTRDGLIEHLKALCPDIHPGPALRSLSEPNETDTDTILITSDDVADDPEFQRDLSSLPVSIPFLMTISRDGNFQVFERTPFGTKRIREATLSLDELLAPTEKPRLPLLDERQKRSEDLPAIWRVKPFPLRLSHHVKPENTWLVRNHGALSITNDRRLMHWDKPTLGARQLADNLPSRRLHWCRRSAENGITQCVIGDLGKPQLWLVTINLKTAAVTTRELPTQGKPVRGVCEYNGTLFVIHKRYVAAHDLDNGEMLSKIHLRPRMHWLNGHYFMEGMTYQALCIEGNLLRFETILIEPDLPLAPDAPRGVRDVLISIFDVDGETGPLGLLALKPAIFRIADKQRFPLSKPLHRAMKVQRVSRDGRRLLVRQFVNRPHHESETVVVNTQTHKVSWCGSDPGFMLEPEVRQVIRQRDMRKKFRGISCLNDRRKSAYELFVLFGANGPLIVELTRREPACFVIRPYAGMNPIRDSDEYFQPHETPSDTRLQLQSAKFPDGSRVFLDSRGLLHLQSSDKNIPEVTFVLTDSELAGWSSDGRMWGPRYFLGNHPATDPATIFNEILRPFLKRIVG